MDRALGLAGQVRAPILLRYAAAEQPVDFLPSPSTTSKGRRCRNPTAFVAILRCVLPKRVLACVHLAGESDRVVGLALQRLELRLAKGVVVRDARKRCMNPTSLASRSRGTTGHDLSDERGARAHRGRVARER
jgi:hypothetical protein